MVDEWRRVAKEKGLDETLPTFAAPSLHGVLLTKWHQFSDAELRPESPHQGVVKIIGSSIELERLCNRPAPGMASDEAVGFNQGFMATLCGKLFKVVTQDSNDGTYKLARVSLPYLQDGAYKTVVCPDDAWVPYDACILQDASHVSKLVMANANASDS
mmetsp:Transcript_77783/g.223360  ORF Transcript_77783/g.223360 Transcript_77783/m.223360 type:complete len:158 (-) Transcript_77783:235-708(-)